MKNYKSKSQKFKSKRNQNSTSAPDINLIDFDKDYLDFLVGVTLLTMTINKKERRRK